MADLVMNPILESAFYAAELTAVEVMQKASGLAGFFMLFYAGLMMVNISLWIFALAAMTLPSLR